MTRDIESPPSQRAAAPADQGLAARALAVLHAEGPRVFWIKLLSELGVYRRLLLLERSLTDPIDETASAVPLDIDLLTRDDVDECLCKKETAKSSVNCASGIEDINSQNIRLHCRVGCPDAETPEV